MSTKREFTIHLMQKATGKTATITATEAAKPFVPIYTFSTNTSTLSTTAGGETKTIEVTSRKTTEGGGVTAVPFTISVSGAGASLVKATQSKAPQDAILTIDDILTITVSPATSYDDTTANVTLTQEGSGKKVTITVTIAGKADDGVFTASPATLTFAPEGGTKTSTITSNSKGKTVGWTVKNKSSLPSWLTVSGEGTGTLSVTAKPNE